jgi:sec-independent protein translocase protein TatB
MMKPMSLPDMIFLFVLALVLFGPKKLPEIARTIGKYMNEFKRASNEFKSQIEQEISNLEVEKRQTILPPTPLQGVASRTLSVTPAESSATPTPVESAAPETAAQSAPADDEPLFATGAGSTAADVTPSTSQESHV